MIAGSNDWAGAWAVDATRPRPLLPVAPGGERQREMAYRFGVNLVMYVLTGNYKADQVHMPTSWSGSADERRHRLLLHPLLPAWLLAVAVAPALAAAGASPSSAGARGWCCAGWRCWSLLAALLDPR